MRAFLNGPGLRHRCQAAALRTWNREQEELCEEAEARGREEEQQVRAALGQRGCYLHDFFVGYEESNQRPSLLFFMMLNNGIYPCPDVGRWLFRKTLGG